ncbi:MAG: SUMF1/EgtB/PvdO family nonheme iron enzyme [Gemmatimonadota bacterium]|nr:SUMF1/EgtB/PvdO family nonheme iron enzyme [Gemmatimonadota bacterium]
MTGGSSTQVTSGQRRLAAIMSADIAGFSRLMHQDEEGTHSRMKRLRRDIIEPTIAEHNGQIIKHMGDGFLAIFDSPLEATRAAIVIQQTIAARNAALGKQFWLQYRIGINLGDVLVEPDDIYGDGVNIAARLQTAATPGQVNISGGVYEQVKNKLVCGYQSLGDEKLKNITDPVRMYRVLPDPAAVQDRVGSLGRALRIGVPAVIGLVLAFGGGLWAARQYNPQPKPEPEPAVIAALSAPPVATARAAPNPELQTALPPAPAVPGPLPPLSPEPSANTRVAVLPPPASAPTAAASDKTFRDCPSCPEMVRLPGGTFGMGSNDDPSEKPIRQVRIAPFAVGKVPVTVGEWRACVDAGICLVDHKGDDALPLTNVSWEDTQLYLKWLSQVTGKAYRLPSEAEWEYAARGGTTTAYYWGARLVPGAVNCKDCGGAYDVKNPSKVASFAPNSFGLHDMSGSVNQWVSDCWHANYQGAPRDGASWDAPNCRQSVLRGGSWRNEASDLRVAGRASYERGVRYPTHGFRVALSQ